jgi:alpha-L-fucosidase
MKSKTFSAALLLLVATLSIGWTSARAQDTLTRDERMAWWRADRFGMFIHWGDYASWAGMYHGHQVAHGGEWIMNMAKIPVAEYQAHARNFNPVKYNPDAWVRMAKEAGMKYIVITAKHHDGFAMFKSDASKWNIVDATVYHRDVLKPLAEACKKYGIKLGFYYSQAQDWNNPGGAVIRKTAASGWANPDSARIDAYTAAHEGHWDPAQTTRSMSEYIDNVAVPQVRELLTGYGKVAVLWWDTPSHMTDAFARKLHDLLKLQPGIITNDRLERPDFPGDYATPEQHIPASAMKGRDFEVCMTMNGTWGYKSFDHNWKSVKTLVRNLIDIASKGGNYLLNVGPKADGTFPEPSVEILKGMGKWMKENSEAIYSTQRSPLGPLDWGRCTSRVENGHTILYLSVFDWPAGGKLLVPGVTAPVISCRLLKGGKKLKTAAGTGGLTIQVPEKAPNEIASVIKLEVNGVLQAD